MLLCCFAYLFVLCNSHGFIHYGRVTSTIKAPELELLFCCSSVLDRDVSCRCICQYPFLWYPTCCEEIAFVLLLHWEIWLGNCWLDVNTVPVSNHSDNEVLSVSPIENSVSRYSNLFNSALDPLLEIHTRACTLVCLYYTHDWRVNKHFFLKWCINHNWYSVTCMHCSEIAVAIACYLTGFQL